MSEADKSLENQVDEAQEPVATTEPAADPATADPAKEAATAATAAAAAEPPKEAEPAKSDKPDKPDKAGDKPDELGELRTQLKASNDRALRSEATATAVRLGMAENRVGVALKLADLSGIDINAEDAGTKIEAALAKVLEDVPELRGAGGTGTVGNFARAKTPSAEDAARESFRSGLNAGR